MRYVCVNTDNSTQKVLYGIFEVFAGIIAICTVMALVVWPRRRRGADHSQPHRGGAALPTVVIRLIGKACGKGKQNR